MGAGLVCAAGSAWGSELSTEEAAGVSGLTLPPAARAGPDERLAPLIEGTETMAGWKPVDQEDLAALRGGFDENACPVVVSAVRARVTGQAMPSANADATVPAEAVEAAEAAEASNAPAGKETPATDAYVRQAGDVGAETGAPAPADLRSDATEAVPTAIRLDQVSAVTLPDPNVIVASAAPVAHERLAVMRGGFDPSLTRSTGTASTAMPVDAVVAVQPASEVVRPAASAAADIPPAAPGGRVGRMAAWKPVVEDRLDELRGGFDVGGLQASFGIERAVYINGDLVVATRVMIPDIGKITPAQASQLSSVLAPLNVNGAAGAAGQLANSPALGNGNGALVVQSGLNNAFAAGAQVNAAPTVIQNSLNGQTIQSLMKLDAGVNTLQSYRSAVATSALSNTLLNAAGRR
ncbi:hypothetical protein [Cupriavidus sp. RAF12]|uniref:hypothetical protein n=1 Tax=Cupriavidus sp. RAF12 TaxID=3233050 RepID=UPI003F8E4011